MAVQRGSKIITNGLVSYWDSMNPKCYPTYNLLSSTEDFNNSPWNKVRATVTPNVIANPVNGAIDADKLVEDTSNNIHWVSQGFLSPIGGIYNYSVYCKAAERTAVTIIPTDTIAIAVNLTTGTILSTVNPFQSSIISTSVTDEGNGWFRCSLAFRSSGNNSYYIEPSNGSSTSYQGDGVSGIYIYGAQLTKGAALKPYQPNLSTLPTLVKDLVGTNNGTLTNGAFTDNGSGVFSSDGTNDYINFGNILNPGLGNFSYGCWFKNDNLADNTFGIIGKSATANIVGRYSIVCDGANIMTILNTSVTNRIAQTTYAPYNDGKWHYIFTTINRSGNMSLYIDGTLKDSINISGESLNNLSTTHHFYLNAYQDSTGTSFNSSYVLQGSTALAMYYNRELSAAEVLQNFNETKSRFFK